MKDLLDYCWDLNVESLQLRRFAARNAPPSESNYQAKIDLRIGKIPLDHEVT